VHCLVPGLQVANLQEEETSSTPDQLVAWSVQHTGFGPATDSASAMQAMALLPSVEEKAASLLG